MLRYCVPDTPDPTFNRNVLEFVAPAATSLLVTTCQLELVPLHDGFDVKFPSANVSKGEIGVSVVNVKSPEVAVLLEASVDFTR